MNTTAVISDFASRPVEQLHGLDGITADQLNAHPGGHPNSVAWLLWHAARQADVQLADLTDTEQLWTREGFRDRFDLGEIGDTAGIGHSAQEAASVRVDDLDLLRDYLSAALRQVASYWSSRSEEEIDEVIDDSYDPPVTRGVRLISIIDDAQTHVGQAVYAAGAVMGRPVGPA